jgi:amino acid transporter
MFWAPLVIASGYIGFAQYAAYLVPALAGFVPTHVLAAAVGIVTLGALYRAIPQIARTALVLGAVALITLVAVALAGLTHPHAPLAQTLAPAFSFGVALPALGAALVITLYDYSGYADVCALGDEVVAASRTIPRAIVISVLAVAAAYVLLNVGVVAALAPKEIAASTTVASLVAERAFGAPFAIAVTVAVLVTAFGSTYGLLLAAARVPYAAARDGDFLAPFARLHPRGRFPSVALVAIGLLALPASLLPLDAVIAALTAGIVLVQGVAQIVALFITRRTQPRAAGRSGRRPRSRRCSRWRASRHRSRPARRCNRRRRPRRLRSATRSSCATRAASRCCRSTANRSSSSAAPSSTSAFRARSGEPR